MERNGTAMVYVSFLVLEEPAAGIGPPGNYTDAPAPNITISAQAGGDMNNPGEEFARSTSDREGCAQFPLPAAGRYRFDAVQRQNHTCDPVGTTVGDWDGTASVRREMLLSYPCM